MTTPEYTAEIEALHAFFEDWYHARVDRDGDAFDRLRTALAEDFEMVVPSGDLRDREAVLTGIEAQYGSRVDADPGFRIEIRDVTLVDETDDRALCRYVEHQRVDGDWEARLSTVLLGYDSDTPTGLAWRHVHETWLPEADARPERY